MLISHLVLPLVPKLLPDAPTMCEMLDVFRSFRSFSFSILYISRDMMLFMAPVSKSVLIFTSKLLFAKI